LAVIMAQIMKGLLYFIFIYFLSSCSFLDTGNDVPHDESSELYEELLNGCEVSLYNGSLNKFPLYMEATKIEIRAYERSYMGEMKPEPEDYKPVNRSKNPIDNYNELIVLNSNQKDSLFRLLFCSKSDGIHRASDCFFPRHKIMFYNDDNNLIESIDICFQCNRIQSKLIDFSNLCDNEVQFYENLIKDFGIKAGFKR
jgi:hypothetical protein